MAPITWKNVNAPSFRDAMYGQALATEQANKAAKSLADVGQVFADHADTKRTKQIALAENEYNLAKGLNTQEGVDYMQQMMQNNAQLPVTVERQSNFKKHRRTVGINDIDKDFFTSRIQSKNNIGEFNEIADRMSKGANFNYNQAATDPNYAASLTQDQRDVANELNTLRGNYEQYAGSTVESEMNQLTQDLIARTGMSTEEAINQARTIHDNYYTDASQLPAERKAYYEKIKTSLLDQHKGNDLVTGNIADMTSDEIMDALIGEGKEFETITDARDRLGTKGLNTLMKFINDKHMKVEGLDIGQEKNVSQIPLSISDLKAMAGADQGIMSRFFTGDIKDRQEAMVEQGVFNPERYENYKAYLAMKDGIKQDIANESHGTRNLYSAVDTSGAVPRPTRAQSAQVIVPEQPAVSSTTSGQQSNPESALRNTLTNAVVSSADEQAVFQETEALQDKLAQDTQRVDGYSVDLADFGLPYDPTSMGVYAIPKDYEKTGHEWFYEKLFSKDSSWQQVGISLSAVIDAMAPVGEYVSTNNRTNKYKNDPKFQQANEFYRDSKKNVRNIGSLIELTKEINTIKTFLTDPNNPINDTDEVSPIKRKTIQGANSRTQERLKTLTSKRNKLLANTQFDYLVDTPIADQIRLLGDDGQLEPEGKYIHYFQKKSSNENNLKNAVKPEPGPSSFGATSTVSPEINGLRFSRDELKQQKQLLKMLSNY